MSKSQRFRKNVTKIGEKFVYVEYYYLYVDQKQSLPKEKCVFKGYHPIGDTTYENIKADGKNQGWIWGQMYQKD